MSFWDFCRERAPSDDPEGDFVKDALADADRPCVRFWGELVDYLDSRHACREAIGAAQRVWVEYERIEGRALQRHRLRMEMKQRRN
jgi:hypothetical protein